MTAIVAARNIRKLHAGKYVLFFPEIASRRGYERLAVDEDLLALIQSRTNISFADEIYRDPRLAFGLSRPEFVDYGPNRALGNGAGAGGTGFGSGAGGAAAAGALASFPEKESTSVAIESRLMLRPVWATRHVPERASQPGDLPALSRMPPA